MAQGYIFIECSDPLPVRLSSLQYPNYQVEFSLPERVLKCVLRMAGIQDRGCMRPSIDHRLDLVRVRLAKLRSDFLETLLACMKSRSPEITYVCLDVSGGATNACHRGCDVPICGIVETAIPKVVRAVEFAGFRVGPLIGKG